MVGFFQRVLVGGSVGEVVAAVERAMKEVRGSTFFHTTKMNNVARKAPVEGRLEIIDDVGILPVQATVACSEAEGVRALATGKVVDVCAPPDYIVSATAIDGVGSRSANDGVVTTDA